MSLIDPRHLLGPFRNTVHFISIIFVVLLFTVYRLATGGVEIAERTLSPAPRGVADVPAAKLPGSVPGKDAVVNDIQNLLSGKNGVANANNAAEPTAAPKKQAPSADSRSLDDIEQALGLGK